MKYLVVKNRRNTESRVLNEPLLNGVGKHGARARIFLFPLPRNLADAMFHNLRGLGRREVTTVSGEVCLRFHLRPGAPETRQLRNLFFEGHSRKQIGDAPFNRKTRVLVIRSVFLRVHGHKGTQQNKEHE